VKIGTQVAVGVAIGYVLGRTRKMRWAIGLASAGTIGRVAKNPGELVQQGSKLLGSSPQVKELTQDVRGRLMEAGKVAAMAAASNQINSLTDRLQERTGSLQQQARPSGGDDSEDRDEERQSSARGGRDKRRDDEDEMEDTRRADEDELADEEEDESSDEREEEPQPAMSGGRSQRLRSGKGDEAEETRRPARTARRITDEDEGDDSERSRRSPVRRVRR
jgi:hypothetical protein